MARFSRFSRNTRFPRFRRFRRNRGTWFPVLGNLLDDGQGTTYHIVNWSGQTGSIGDDRALGPTQDVWPLTKDFTQFSDTLNPDNSLAGPSLRDTVEGQNWRVNRIVGKIHVDVTEDNSTVQNSTWPLVQVAAGIFVARGNDADQSLPDLTFDEVDPFQVRNAQNSWLWRRTWMLSRPLASNVGFSAVPCSNAEMSVAGGDIIDTKVKRRIKREHRLWFIIAAIGWSGNFVTTTPNEGINQPYVRYNLDIRLHGGMTRAREPATF